MIVSRSNFSMYAGDSKRLTVYVVDGKGIPVDITGYSIIWTLIHRDRIICEKAVGQGLIIFDGAGGRIDIDLTPEDTKGKYGSGKHSLVITDPMGNVYTVLAGHAELKNALVM